MRQLTLLVFLFLGNSVFSQTEITWANLKCDSLIGRFDSTKKVHVRKAFFNSSQKDLDGQYIAIEGHIHLDLWDTESFAISSGEDGNGIAYVGDFLSAYGGRWDQIILFKNENLYDAFKHNESVTYKIKGKLSVGDWPFCYVLEDVSLVE